MTTLRNKKINRRSLLGYAAVALAAPSVVRAETIRRNISSFRVHDWQDHFDALGKGIIISDTVTKSLQHWTSDGEMRIYPTSVPLTDELTKRGYTEVVEKRKNPSWAPTPSMRERQSGMAGSCRGGESGQPLGHSCTVPVVAVLPYSRDTGYAQDRPSVVKRLHRFVQQTNRGGL